MVTGLLAAAIVLLDFCTSLLMPRQPPRIIPMGNHHSRHLCLVFPGFSNPAGPFGRGMPTVLGHDKLILVVDYGTKMNDHLIYEALMRHIELTVGHVDEITIYGHSMGGQVGMIFRQRYLQEGAKFGPIRTTVLDCSPMQPNSLQLPLPALLLRLVVALLWPGVMLQGLVFLGNIFSRKVMPILHDSSTDHKLYKQYARGIALFNTRAWRAQMLYMLRFKAQRVEADETARVFYIGSTKPELDKLVRQTLAVSQWREKFPHLDLQKAEVSHAWPLERPATYSQLFWWMWKAAR